MIFLSTGNRFEVKQRDPVLPQHGKAESDRR